MHKQHMPKDTHARAAGGERGYRHKRRFPRLSVTCEGSGEADTYVYTALVAAVAANRVDSTRRRKVAAAPAEYLWMSRRTPAEPHGSAAQPQRTRPPTPGHDGYRRTVEVPRI